jgi:hypothetical protein
MNLTPRLTEIALAATILVISMAGNAGAANENTGKRFCNKYAESTAAIVSEAIKQNPGCLDPDKGVHPSAEHHFSWCMQNTRSTVKGAAENIRQLVAKCTGTVPDAFKPKKKDAKNGGKRFCNQYAETTASVDALKTHPSCLDPSRGVHADVKSHFTWCMKTPREEVEGAGMHIRDLVAACTQ